MEGAADPPELRGIIPHSFKHIFEKIGLGDNQQFLVWMSPRSVVMALLDLPRHPQVRASYLEIYNEEIRDLLSKNPRNKLELKESVDSGVYVKVRRQRGRLRAPCALLAALPSLCCAC